MCQASHKQNINAESRRSEGANNKKKPKLTGQISGIMTKRRQALRV
jgi:hypothetical protein